MNQEEKEFMEGKHMTWHGVNHQVTDDIDESPQNTEDIHKEHPHQNHKNLSFRVIDEYRHSDSMNVWRKMRKLSTEYKAISLDQGRPDFQGSTVACKKAAELILHGKGVWNQYAPVQGVPHLRRSLSNWYHKTYGFRYNPNEEILVISSGSVGIYTVMQTFINPGDEVILFEPFFPFYLNSIRLAGGIPVCVELKGPRFDIIKEDILRVLTDKTKLIVLNTPHNPTGHIATQQELQDIADIAIKNDILVFSDEVYETFAYKGYQHHRIADIEGMHERTITMGSASKMFCLTGWRVGWLLSSKRLTKALTSMHADVTFVAVTPLQEAIAYAFDDGHFEGIPELVEDSHTRIRNQLIECGLQVSESHGGFYLVVDIGVTGMNDLEYAEWSIKNLGISCTPLHIFYKDKKAEDCTLVRLCISKKKETIDRVVKILKEFNETE